MKISDKNEVINYINELVDTNNLNMSIGDMLSEVVGKKEIANIEELTLLSNKFNRPIREILINKIFNYFDLDEDNEDDVILFNECIAKIIDEADINKYLNNPYYKNIKINNVKYQDYSLRYDHYEPLELFSLLDMKRDEKYQEINSIAYFKEKFPFISLEYKGVTWMSITPNEIETMQLAVNSAYGKVIVYGLGLGYYPYMISLKDEVKEIVIIEKDKNIIELFNKYLLPQFEHKEKIRIVNDDAFNYMKKENGFDYAFIDLWHDPFDGLSLWIKAKSLEKKDHKYFYWLESSFYLLLRRCFISLLEEQMSNAKENGYLKAKTITDEIINKYYFLTKNVEIKNKSQLDDLLTDSNLLNLLLNN